MLKNLKLTSDINFLSTNEPREETRQHGGISICSRYCKLTTFPCNEKLKDWIYVFNDLEYKITETQ